MRPLFFIIIFLLSTLWAVTFSAAQSIDTSFVPRGIDLSVNEHLAPMGTATEALDWYIHEDIEKRDGYQKITGGAAEQPGNGVYIGIQPYIDRDGNKRLLGLYQVIDWNTVDNINAFFVWSDENSYDFHDSNLYNWIYSNVTPAWSIYNNVLIMANGHNRPIRFNGTNVKPLVETAPGTWDVAPLKERSSSSQLLDGDYYYALRTWGPCESQDVCTTHIKNDDSLFFTNVTPQIHVDSDWVVIYAPWLYAHSDSTDSPYQIKGDIGRTKSGASPDSVYHIANFVFYRSGSLDIDSVYYVDSIPDDSLGNASHPYIGRLDTAIHIADTASDTLLKMGQMKWLGTSNNPGGREAWTGIAKGMREVDTTWYATDYVYALYDSSTGMHTELSPILRVPMTDVVNDSIYDYQIELAIPKLLSNRDYCWRLIYRRKVTKLQETVTDTLFRMDAVPAVKYGINDMWALQLPGPGYYCKFPDGSIDKNHTMRFWDETSQRYMCGTRFQHYDTTVVKTHVGTYYLLDTIKNVEDTAYADSVYFDSLNWADAENKPTYLDVWTLPAMNYPTVFADGMGDRLYMADGSKVYFCQFDETGVQIGRWSEGLSVSIAPDDGDEITALHGGDGFLDVYKNDSWYRLYQIGREDAEIRLMDGAIGCIAPNSVVDAPNGGMAWLHSSGIYMYSGHYRSLYKSSGGNIRKISQPVDNWLNGLTISQRRDCVGWIDEDGRNLIFSFPSLDTSLVMSLISGEWCKWTFAPDQVCRYDTAYRTDLRPADDILFVDNTDSVYKFGGTALDAGDSVQSVWKSALMYTTGEYGKIIRFGLWKYSNSDNGIDFNIYDLSDTGVVRTIRDTTPVIYRRNAINPRISQGYRIELKSRADSLAIDRIDLRYQPSGETPEH